MGNKAKVKKVCMIAMASYPGDPRIRREAEALEEAGYEVDVLCRYSGNQPTKEKFGRITAYRIMNAPQRDNRIVYLLQSFIFLVVAFFYLLVLSINKRYYIIQAHNLPDYLIFAAAIHKLFGVKLILDIHDPSVDLFEEKWPGKKNKVLKFLLAKAERYSCKLADNIITVTNTCKERLVERGNAPEKITLILNTANEDLFRFNNQRSFKEIKAGLRIMYHGTIAERFGLHNVIEAMPILLKEVPGSVLNIYGRSEGNYFAKLNNLISKLKLENNVKLNGIIFREDIPEEIKNHDIGIVPYLKTDYMSLALPTKAFEYIATGLPLVSTRLKDLSETFDDSCITYIEDSEAQKIAEAILFVCFNPETVKKRVGNAYQKLSDISGKVMKDRIVSLYNGLVN